MNERSAFEQAMRGCSTLSLDHDKDDPDGYRSGVTEAAWLAWQHRAALANAEQAAPAPLSIEWPDERDAGWGSDESTGWNDCLTACKAAYAKASAPALEWQWETEGQDGCNEATAGWRCTRQLGHEGPCAAIRNTAQRDAPPSAHELTVELRNALGLFSGAMPKSPKDVWDEAIRNIGDLLQTVRDLKGRADDAEAALAHSAKASAATQPAEPLFWIADWQYEHLVSGHANKGPLMAWPDPQNKSGLVPVYAASPVGQPNKAADVLRRIRAWDALDSQTDGAYWKREINAALASSGAPDS